MSNRLEDMVPEARIRAEKMLSALDTQGRKYFVSETLRTAEVQEAYYAQGRRNLMEVNALRSSAGLRPITEQENNKTITNCDGEYRVSPHQGGKAIDVYPVIQKKVQWSVTEANLDSWNILGETGELSGLEWGGRWKPLDKLGVGWDAPHFQLKG